MAKTFTPALLVQNNLGNESSIQRFFDLGNGWGASVVRHSRSYGGREGLFELAVIENFDRDFNRFKINSDNPITGDVIGWLTENDVQDTLRKISELPVNLKMIGA